MERRFNITMHAPLGPRYGQLRFTQCSDSISGTLALLGSNNPFTGHITENGLIEFSGKLTSKINSFSYFANGTIKASELMLNLVGDRYAFRIIGQEIKTQEEHVE